MAIKRGSTVTIKKGVRITTTLSSMPEKVAGRTYKVKIHDVRDGWSIPVGFRNYDADGTVTTERTSYDRHDSRRLEEKFGKLSEEELLAKTHEGEHYDRKDGSSYCHLHVRLTPPSVVWPGTGGYWHYVDCADIPEFDEETS
jgi:hypothetical protein